MSEEQKQLTQALFLGQQITSRLVADGLVSSQGVPAQEPFIGYLQDIARGDVTLYAGSGELCRTAQNQGFELSDDFVRMVDSSVNDMIRRDRKIAKSIIAGTEFDVPSS